MKRLFIWLGLLTAIFGLYIPISMAVNDYAIEKHNEYMAVEALEYYAIPPKPQIDIYKLYDQINVIRIENGSEPLRLNPKLNQSALYKCEDMTTKGYWAHNAPDGTEPWVFITKTGLKYAGAGENLANSFNTEKSVISGWLNSKAGHRENLLNKRFTDVGYGICTNKENGKYFIVQHLAQL